MTRLIRATALVAAALGWSVTTSVVAGEPPLTAPPGPSMEPRHVPPQAGPGYYPRTPAAAVELPPGYPPVNNAHSDRPVRDWLHHGRPLGCWASFNGYGCSSLHSTCAFIFGSCHTFYGEPCLKGAPPSAMPPWAGSETGYRGHPLPGEAGRQSLPLGSCFRRMFCPSCQH